MKRFGGMIGALLVALALAAPAAAQTPAEGWQAWTWAGVVERLSGWADGVLGVFAASETTPAEEGEEAPPTPTEDSVLGIVNEAPEQTCESFPKMDPDG